MNAALYKMIVKRTKGHDIQAWRDLGDALKEEELAEWKDRFRAEMEWYAMQSAWECAEELRRLYFRALCVTARTRFEDFLTAVEFERKPEDKFYEPRKGYLKPIVEAYQQVADGELDFLSVSLPKRAGKALTLDTKLLSPTGWIRMGDIRVGDVLIGADGKPCTVTDVFPQGKVPVYEVTIRSGRMRYSVRTCGNHLWEVQTQDDRTYSRQRGKRLTRIMTTKQMLDSRMKLGWDNHNNYSIDYMKPAEFEEKYLPIDPYVLGVLIGDGCITKDVRFTSFDEELVDKVEKLLPSDCRVRKAEHKDGAYFIVGNGKRDAGGHPVANTVGIELRNLGLAGHKAYDKFIPEIYKWGSIEQRWELLRGLMDTDGCADKKGCEYSTVSKRLAEDVAFLVRSLGGYASIKERMGSYKKGDERIKTVTNYRVTIVFPSGNNPFYLQRKAEKYTPKRKQLRHFIDEIKLVGEEEAQCICVDNDSHLFVATEYMIPTHNSQLGINFCLWMSGREPNRSTLMEGTGDALVNSFYQGALEYVQEPNEYCFGDIFPHAPLVQTNADTKIINLDKKSRFPTIMCRSIDARQVGLSEATNLLYLDDCVEGREEAKNRLALDKKWEILTGDVIGRALEGTPIVICGTRYSLYDPIGRLQEHAQRHGWRWRAVEVPALDPVTDESNYCFWNPKIGRWMFTTGYFREQRELLSKEQFESEFQQEPFESKGVLFPEEELNYFYELPVDKAPDTVLAVCDPADKGADSTCMPIAAVYGDDVYIVDVVFDDATPEYTKPECADAILRWKVGVVTFETNGAGGYFARDVQELVRQRGGSVSIRTKYATQNKQTRIEFASDQIKKRFWFKARGTYERRSQYGTFMAELTRFTRVGKKQHDDAPDGLAMLENELRNAVWSRVEVFDRPF